MTIESNIGKNVYTGNGSTTVFPFLFKAWDPDEIQVVMTTAELDTEVDVTKSVKIEISDTELGGTVTFSAPPAVGDKIAILRDMNFLQGDRYPANSRFDPHVIEERFDRDCAERQQLKEKLDRAVLVGPTYPLEDKSLVADALLEARDEAIAARNETVAARDETLEARYEAVTARDHTVSLAAQTRQNMLASVDAQHAAELAADKAEAAVGDFVNQADQSRMKVWYGTLDEYNALTTIYENWEYNILERAIL